MLFFFFFFKRQQLVPASRFEVFSLSSAYKQLEASLYGLLI